MRCTGWQIYNTKRQVNKSSDVGTKERCNISCTIRPLLSDLKFTVLKNLLAAGREGNKK